MIPEWPYQLFAYIHGNSIFLLVAGCVIFVTGAFATGYFNRLGEILAEKTKERFDK